MLMDGNRIEDLQRMHSLFLRVNALESLRQALSAYIRKTGQGIVMDEEKDKDMVSSLLEFKASLDTIWEESFSKNDAFCNTIKDAFEHLINLRQVIIYIFLLLYLFYIFLLLYLFSCSPCFLPFFFISN
jgi:cullin-4